MPLTLPGSDVALVRNPSTGRFDLQFETTTQNPQFSDDQSHAVLSLIYERQGEWWADASGKRGSLLWTVKEDRKASASKIKGYVEAALQPLVDQGRIRNLAVTATRVKPGRIDLGITYLSPSGLPVSIRPSLGY